MDFKFQKIKTIVSALSALIIAFLLPVLGRCIDPPCGGVNLFGGYVINFVILSLKDLVFLFIINFGIIYFIWSLFQKKS